ncbi:MAG TPA: hypothetical protein VEO19_11180 [Terriglobia bacterium]|nr:hypothetical protein [Terriglobia bacterium]
MLIIREAQLRILVADAFERSLVQHVIRCFPERARRIGNDELPAVIKDRRARAARYFSSESGIRTFVDLTCVFGDTFDEDPELPWAREILKKPGISEADRRQMLHARARRHLLRARAKGKIQHA